MSRPAGWRAASHTSPTTWAPSDRSTARREARPPRMRRERCADRSDRVLPGRALEPLLTCSSTGSSYVLGRPVAEFASAAAFSPSPVERSSRLAASGIGLRLPQQVHADRELGEIRPRVTQHIVVRRVEAELHAGDGLDVQPGAAHVAELVADVPVPPLHLPPGGLELAH